MKTTDIRVLCTVFLVLLHTELRDAADVIENPQNAYGMEGTSINLTCVVTGEVTADPFEWREYITEPTGGVRIFSDPPTNPLDTSRYEIYGRYTLNIKSLNWQDNGGEYGCKVFSESSPHTAHVFVFQQHSMSAVRMQAGEKTQLLCESRFGAMDNLMEDPDITQPTITLDIRGNQLPNVNTQLIPKTSSEPWILRAAVNYTADKNHDGEDFGCTVTIQEPYAQIKDTIKLDIMYQVEEPSFTPFNAMYYVDEYINCTAYGNPDPSYEWRSIDSPMGPGVSIPGSQLSITADMLGGTNQWECSATNNLDGKPYTASKTITFEVEPNPGQPGPVTGGGVEGWKVAVGICVPLAIIAIAVGIFFGLRYKKKKRASAYEESAAPPQGEKTGKVNPGAALPIEGDLSNGKVRDVDAARTPVSMQPNPLPQNNPANRSKDSPGYADLGVKQITGSYPGMNVSMSSSMDSFDDGEGVNPNPNPAAPGKPPAGRQLPAAPQPPAGQQPPAAPQPPAGRMPPAAHQPPRYVNASFVPGPPPAAVRPEDLKPNHPDTFV